MKLALGLVVVLAALCLSAEGRGTKYRYNHDVGKRVSDNNGRVVCYYGSWAVYRPDLGKFDVENIDPFVCTHIIYAFAGLSPTDYTIQALDSYNDLPDNYGKDAYDRFTNLTKQNPSLVAMLGIGGWNEGSTKYSTMANDPNLRAKFVASVTPFLQKYGFQGLDVDWEYPTQRGGAATDKDAYTALLTDLRTEFDKNGFLLSAALSAGAATIADAYDIPAISQQLDYLNIMCYDYHGSWETFTGENAPTYARPDDADQTFNVDYSINYWLQGGAPAQKINLGLATYGHNWVLADPTVNGIDAPAYGAGDAGPYTRTAGTLGYNEICVDLQQGGWTYVIDDSYKSPYAYKGNQWVSYDDPDSLAIKCDLANSYGLGGAMIWSIETDDFQNSCGAGAFPLLATINQYMRGGATRPPTTPPPTTTPYTGPPTTPPSTTTKATTTTVTPTPTDVCQYSGYQADPNDCTTFYDCVPNADGTWTVFTFHCAAGTIFDPSIDNCNYPEDVPDCHAHIIQSIGQN